MSERQGQASRDRWVADRSGLGAGSVADETLEHCKLPDPQGQAVEDLRKRVGELESLVRSLAEERVGR